MALNPKQLAEFTPNIANELPAAVRRESEANAETRNPAEQCSCTFCSCGVFERDSLRVPRVAVNDGENILIPPGAREGTD
ncbi:hypothetical protein M513_10284 [Trichuris suis]|uniref:Uncharacterized protein n=1 Tax=Trichuris suis TaxID=68888 RepID=A0A085LVC5_9BILA|nr:hypothetical protein M513_10284 [Trichuris suis]